MKVGRHKLISFALYLLTLHKVVFFFFKKKELLIQNNFNIKARTLALFKKQQHST